MQILHTVNQLRAWSRAARATGKIVGLVPTMGALHEGHASLIRAARNGSGAVAVSIFVNPTQFGPNEDFTRYPRAFEADCALAESLGADAVFAPGVEEMYPAGAATFVSISSAAPAEAAIRRRTRRLCWKPAMPGDDLWERVTAWPTVPLANYLAMLDEGRRFRP